MVELGRRQSFLKINDEINVANPPRAKHFSHVSARSRLLFLPVPVRSQCDRSWWNGRVGSSIRCSGHSKLNDRRYSFSLRG
jgi:hypothetical protein